MHPDCSQARREVKKQNHPLREPGRKLHLLNTVRGLSLPAQWPWPSPCPGLSMCWLPLPGWELLIREANSPESHWEWRAEATQSLGYIFKGKEAFTCESDSFLLGTLQVKEEALYFFLAVKAGLWAGRGSFLSLFSSQPGHTGLGFCCRSAQIIVTRY